MRAPDAAERNLKTCATDTALLGAWRAGTINQASRAQTSRSCHNDQTERTATSLGKLLEEAEVTERDNQPNRAGFMTDFGRSLRTDICAILEIRTSATVRVGSAIVLPQRTFLPARFTGGGAGQIFRCNSMISLDCRRTDRCVAAWAALPSLEPGRLAEIRWSARSQAMHITP